MLATWHHGDKEFMSKPPADGCVPIAMAETSPQPEVQQPAPSGADGGVAGKGGNRKTTEAKGGGKNKGAPNHATGAGEASARGNQGGGGVGSEFKKLVRETQKRKDYGRQGKTHSS